ncbi:MAG: hypothetical protein ACYS8W_14085 [Planctomycetota bacterium]|jgi:hypothetical protein
MFRKVYGLKPGGKYKTDKGSINIINQVADFIESNDIVPIHELANLKKNEYVKEKFSHGLSPTLYFCLPDGSQPVAPAIDFNDGESILENLKQLMEAFNKSGQ